MIEEEPRARPAQGVQTAVLEGWSEEDLLAHIAALRAEIARAEAALAARAAQRAAADALFRRPG